MITRRKIRCIRAENVELEKTFAAAISNNCAPLNDACTYFISFAEYQAELLALNDAELAGFGPLPGREDGDQKF